MLIQCCSAELLDIESVIDSEIDIDAAAAAADADADTLSETVAQAMQEEIAQKYSELLQSTVHSKDSPMESMSRRNQRAE